MLKWFAELVENGTLHMTVVGLDRIHGPEDENETLRVGLDGCHVVRQVT